MVSAVVPNGVVVAEEAEASACFCYPPNKAFRRWIDWFGETMRRRGGDPDLGNRLPGLFRAAGLHDIGLRIIHPAARFFQVWAYRRGPADRVDRASGYRPVNPA